MDKLKNYLLTNFSHIYFSIFLPLYVIATVIMLIKIAAYTAYIQLTLVEMLKLYIFMLPELLFYMLPVTFFVSAVMTISKLSFDYEMLVIFSLGIKPSKIVMFFFKLAALQSLLLFILFFIITPHTKDLSENFMIQKRSEAKFNIEASEYGHKFGDWLIFVGKDNQDGSYGRVILFNQDEKEETIIAATKADIRTEEDVLKLELLDGKGYKYTKDTLSQMKFRTMSINDANVIDTKEHSNILEYWFKNDKIKDEYEEGTYWYMTYSARHKSLMKKLASQTLISIFPLLSVFFILSIGVINARHQKSFTYLYIFTIVIAFYAGAFTLPKFLVLFTVPALSLVTLALGYFIYNKKIAKRY